MPKNEQPTFETAIERLDAIVAQMESDTLPLEKVNDLADTVLAQKLSEVSGVGLVTIEGNQKPAVRVRVNPAALAGQGLSMEDVRSA